jgi:hypothetical protein
MKLSKRDSVLLLLIALVAGLGGLYWFYVKPARAELESVRTEVEEVERRNADLRDTLRRLVADARRLSGQTAAELRLAKAVPDSAQVPGAIVQIERLADRSNVRFTALQTQTVTELGGFAGRAFQLKVTGRFFDVDDFLYRLHRQVILDAKGRPRIGGRLFAVTKLELAAVDAAAGAAAGTQLTGKDDVEATIDLVAFSASTSAAPSAAAGSSAPQTVSPDIGQAASVPAATSTGGTP